jgi:hypothetical protein
VSTALAFDIQFREPGARRPYPHVRVAGVSLEWFIDRRPFEGMDDASTARAAFEKAMDKAAPGFRRGRYALADYERLLVAEASGGNWLGILLPPGGRIVYGTSDGPMAAISKIERRSNKRWKRSAVTNTWKRKSEIENQSQQTHLGSPELFTSQPSESQ